MIARLPKSVSKEVLPLDETNGRIFLSPAGKKH
jgi:hypothetical protein